MCTEFPGQGRPSVLLCRSGRHGLCCLFSAAVHRAVEWAVQLPLCSGHTPWLNRLKAVFSNKWACELDSQPGCSRRRNSRTGKAFCSHTPGFLTEQGHWLWSANYWLCLPASPLESFWAAQLPGVVTSPSGQMRLEDTVHSGWDCDSAPRLGTGKPGSRAAKLLV